MKKIFRYTLLTIISFVFACSGSNETKDFIVDETGKTEAIDQSIDIDNVWAGHPVGFSLMTHQGRQYIAYYNANRNMVVGQRNLDQDEFELHIMPATERETSNGTSTVLGWDSHNSVTMGIDKEGYIHLSGNMHVHPLTYFMSSKPDDISSLVQYMEMTGSNEGKCTYPNFMTSREGDLIFHYRDGSSGNGNEIYNVFNTVTKEWERLLDKPLTDGQGKMNAYQSEPELMDDDWYHVYWVWRDTPDCATNHDLSYMKSPDLKNWYNAFGDPVELPATINEKSLIVDPIPPGGGIINLAARLCLDKDQKPVFVYHKYGKNGNLQLYIAQLNGRKWKTKRITDWDYRWEFSGGGSIIFEVYLHSFLPRDDGFYEINYSHVKYGNGTILLDEKFNNVGKVLKPKPFGQSLHTEGKFRGLQVQTAGDLGHAPEKDTRYLLKWETLPQNRDMPREKPWPEPSKLKLLKVKQAQGAFN